MARNSRPDDHKLALPPDKYRWDDVRGGYDVHESIIVANEQNPRPNKGDEPKKLQRLMESIRSDEHGGIHLPVSGYIADMLFHLNEGHRRVFANRHIIKDMLAGWVEGQPRPDTEKYEWIPVSIEPPRQSKLAVLIRMQSSDSFLRPASRTG